MATKKIDWKKVKPGKWFSANINGSAVKGRIQKEEDQIFLCQDTEDGSECNDKLGFKYSYTISEGTPYNMRNENVKNFKFLSNPTITIGRNIVEFIKRSIQIGCTNIPNAIVRQVFKLLKK